MLVIGLTGGIGAGKTTVADLFAKYGAPIIDADILAREVTQVNQPAFNAIVAHFGKDLLQSNGTLDRKKLRDIIFSDEAQRYWLENLLHPLIEKRILDEIRKISSLYCIVVIPLLFEVKPYDFIDRILVIDAPKQLQVERVITRDKTTGPQIEAILEAQTTREERSEKAHDIIYNDGSLAELERQVGNLHQKYIKLATQL